MEAKNILKDKTNIQKEKQEKERKPVVHIEEVLPYEEEAERNAGEMLRETSISLEGILRKRFFI